MLAGIKQAAASPAKSWIANKTCLAAFGALQYVQQLHNNTNGYQHSNYCVAHLFYLEVFFIMFMFNNFHKDLFPY